MIELVIFELGASLVQLELIDALAFAQAALELRPGLILEDVAARVRQLAGISRHELAYRLVRQYDLRAAALARLSELSVANDWQVLLQLRAQAYDRLLAMPDTIERAAWPQPTALLYSARRMGCRVALVSQASARQGGQVLRSLNLSDAFDLVLARDEAEFGLADPELYLSVARELEVEPQACLSVLRSLLGVRAALGAGMSVLAMAQGPARQQLLPFASCERCVLVDNHSALPGHLYAQIASRQRDPQMR